MYTIVTHPTHWNYGGLLQTLAMQKALAKLGARSQTIEYMPPADIISRKKLTLKEKWNCWYTLMKFFLGARGHVFPGYLYPFFFKAFKIFHIKSWNLDDKRRKILQLSRHKAFIVGSDQVWRATYARYMESTAFFFLSFATQEQRQHSIAYAASFGSDEWEGTPEETDECARLLKDFKAVSVREHSGIRICQDSFGVNAVQMPDPTLLLDPDDYSEIIRSWWTRRLSSPSIASYILDSSDSRQALAADTAEQLQLSLQPLTVQNHAPQLMNRIPLSTPQWLRCVRDAECLLTDSFHGCVFAIIFNTPFVCLGNENRGSARFDSLLDTFGLQDRLLINPTAEQVAECMNTPIDWERVNSIRNKEKLRGLEFLKSNIE